MWAEQYATNANIEAETAASIARTMLLPAALRHIALAEAAGLAGWPAEVARAGRRLRRRDRGARTRRTPTRTASRAWTWPSTPATTRSRRWPKVRELGDELEKVVADDLWPLPKYSEILFIK